MKSYGDYGYKADKGKMWVFAPNEWASYKDRVGEPYDDTIATKTMVEDRVVIEVDDPDWVVTTGYKAVYDRKGSRIGVGNGYIFPLREMAEAEANDFNNRPWNKDDHAYVIETIYEGRLPRECREYNGKTVHNMDTWRYAYPIGSYVEEEVVDEAINALPPACMRSDCMQMGEPADTRIDENGNGRNTYETFKKIAEGIYEYCGDCFKGENVRRGKEMSYV